MTSVNLVAKGKEDDAGRIAGRQQKKRDAENIATLGVDWVSLPVGTRVRLGETAEVEITQIGKECHNKCAIFYKAGDCIMPRQGVFGRVLTEGLVRPGDRIDIVE